METARMKYTVQKTAMNSGKTTPRKSTLLDQQSGRIEPDGQKGRGCENRLRDWVDDCMLGADCNGLTAFRSEPDGDIYTGNLCVS